MDYLALHGLIQKGHVEALGQRVAVGKESDIYTVLGPARSSEKIEELSHHKSSVDPSTVSSLKSKHHPRKNKNPTTRRPPQISPQASGPPSKNPSPQSPIQLILKIHRLGRVSFRTLKTNRAYVSATHKPQSFQSWLHISRLSATKEYLFQSALYAAGFPVPQPIAQNRHTVLMQLVDAPRLQQVKSIGDNSIEAVSALYAELMSLIVRLASVGVIHGDFNEFNILIHESKDDQRENITPILIDFPQLLSTSHPNAASYFARDVTCIKTFFRRRFGFTSDSSGPHFNDALKDLAKTPTEERIDGKVEAAGFSRKMGRDLEGWMNERIGESEQREVDLEKEEGEGGEEEEEESGGLDDLDEGDDGFDEDSGGASSEHGGVDHDGIPITYDSTLVVSDLKQEDEKAVFVQPQTPAMQPPTRAAAYG